MSLSPPRLSRDKRSYRHTEINRKNIPHGIESKTPKDLPGKGEKNIITKSFYPYEESINSDNTSLLSPEKNVSKDDINDDKESIKSLDSSTSAESNGSTLYEDKIKSLETESNEIVEEEEIKQSDRFSTFEENDEDVIILDQERSVNQSKEIENFLKNNRFNVYGTYILTSKNGEISYFVKVCSFYGTYFFIKFDEKVIIGDEKIFLNETDEEFNLVVFSPNYTEFLKEAEAVTMFDESLVYKGKIYGNIDEMVRTLNPTSYPLVLEKSLETPFDPFKLAVSVHDMWIDIDSLYRELLASSYNSMLDCFDNFIKDIYEKRKIFEDLDQNNEKESEVHDKSFVSKLDNKEFPDKSETHRVKFLRKVESKYSQAEFILWKRVYENIMSAKKEFDNSITSVLIEMKKDFPDDDIEVDDSIDVSRSYPGKMFLR